MHLDFSHFSHQYLLSTIIGVEAEELCAKVSKCLSFITGQTFFCTQLFSYLSRSSFLAQVLESLVETARGLIAAGRPLPYLEAVEVVARGSLLGQLLPLLITGLNHEQVKCLPLADSLIAKVVQLILSTSQVSPSLGSVGQPDQSG